MRWVRCAWAFALASGCSAEVVELTGQDAAGASFDAAPMAEMDGGHPADAAAGDASEPRVFSGVAGTLWLDAIEGSFAPHDLTAWHITASVERAGGWSPPIELEGSADGTFAGEVPAGRLRIELQPPAPGPNGPSLPMMAVVTDRDHVDLREVRHGRPQTQGPARGTAILMRARLATPWRSGDWLILRAGRAGIAREIFNQTMWPADGAMDLRPVTVPAWQLPSFLGRPGDDLFVERHRRSRTAHGHEETLVERAEARTLDLPPGQETPLDLALQPVPTRPLTLRYDGTALDDATVVHPRAIHTWGELSMHTFATERDADGMDLFPDAMWQLEPSSHLGSPSTAVPETPLGRVTCWQYGRWLALPETVEWPWISVRRVCDANPPELVLMSPPLRIRLNGRSAREPLQRVGPTPLVEWDAPPGARVDGYAIALAHVPPMDGSFIGWTEQPRFQIPPGWLRAGQRYMVVITAHDRAGESIVERPRRRPAVGASSVSATEPFAP